MCCSRFLVCLDGHVTRTATVIPSHCPNVWFIPVLRPFSYILVWHPATEKPESEAFEALPEVLDWVPPDPTLPESPDLRSRNDPFDLWLDSLAPSVDKPPLKLLRISV